MWNLKRLIVVFIQFYNQLNKILKEKWLFLRKKVLSLVLFLVLSFSLVFSSENKTLIKEILNDKGININEFSEYEFYQNNNNLNNFNNLNMNKAINIW